MKQGKLEAAEMVFKKVRSTVQGQDSSVGRDSREQSGSPTALFGRESSPVVSNGLKLMWLIKSIYYRRSSHLLLK